jgi:uncharacterized protein YjiS (DUF1127 family)
MSIQCEALQKQHTSNLPAIMMRLTELRRTFEQFYSDWTYNRRIKRSRRVLESLPEHILHDIGWPNVDDRLPGIAKKQSR